MKHVRVRGDDLLQFRKAIEGTKEATPTLERDYLRHDDVDFEIVRPQGSTEPLTSALSISFESGSTRYLCVVRTAPDGGHVLSLSVIQKTPGADPDIKVRGYVLDSHQLTTLSGRLKSAASAALFRAGEGRPPDQAEFVKLLSAVQLDD